MDGNGEIQPFFHGKDLDFHHPFDTPRKINMEPQNGVLQYDFPFQLDDF